MNHADIISKMTLQEKADFCSGADFWHLQSLERLGIPRIMITDGPHGLRKQKEKKDKGELMSSYPAVCFPTAVTTACSWDPELIEKMGEALGEECLEEKVSVLLGPGVNMKRSPLCGRNFEYFSEDPFLAGSIGAAFVQGVQSRGVGTSLKHFAANNQEARRMTVSTVADERTLREIYLAAFEKVVKESQPWTVMNAYNRLNGVYCAEDKWLLNDVLRDEWGYEGLVVSDWIGKRNTVAQVHAGNDLMMPGYPAQVQDIVRGDFVDRPNQLQVRGPDDVRVHAFGQMADFSALQALIDAQAAALVHDPLGQPGQIARDHAHRMAHGVRVFLHVRLHRLVAVAVLVCAGEHLALADDVVRGEEVVKGVALLPDRLVDCGAACHRLREKRIVIRERRDLVPVLRSPDGHGKRVSQAVGHDLDEIRIRRAVVVKVRLHAGLSSALFSVKVKPEGGGNPIRLLMIEYGHQPLFFVHFFHPSKR